MDMKIIEVTLPKLGESIVGATVVQWFKQIGDQVMVDEPLLEVSTDKINSEIPSPINGIIREICVQVDQEVEIGSLLAKIEEIGKESLRNATLMPQDTTSSEVPQMPMENLQTPKPKQTILKKGELSPAVLRMAQIEGISLEELDKIQGTGDGSRVTKRDIEHFVQERNQFSQKTAEEPLCPLKMSIDEPSFSHEERIALSGMRKTIADNMVRSFYEAPHASLVTEADVTDVMKLIQREKERFFQTHGAKLTITSFLLQALTKSLQQFPMLNASLQNETIILKRYINVGIAVNIDKGLIVPVIKNCQERNIASLAKAVSDLSSRARAGKLSASDIVEGTVTLTNFGMTGALIGVPIIRYPEVAIIGAGTVQKRVIVREDDSLSVRQMLYITLTFDHRIIDGIYGCQFLSAFKHHLESVSIH